MAKGNSDEYRYRITSETIERASSAGPAEALEIMIEFWGSMAQYAARHGVDIKTAAEIFNRGIGCPMCKRPWMWDGKRWTCPMDCGLYIADRNEVSGEVRAVLAEQHRDEQAQLHRSKSTPAYITEREPEMVRARKIRAKRMQCDPRHQP